MHIASRPCVVVPGRVELPTSTLSVWRSNQLSYRTGFSSLPRHSSALAGCPASTFSHYISKNRHQAHKRRETFRFLNSGFSRPSLQKGGVPAAPSGTATLLRLSPNHQFYPRTLLAVTHFRYPRLSWLDGRCVQGPGTYSPRHG